MTLVKNTLAKQLDVPNACMIGTGSLCMQHALSEYDLESAEKLRQLSKPCQSLLLRLLLRKGPWFRVDSLWYEDVEDPGAAVKALHAAGFMKTLSADEPTDFQGAVSLLRITNLCCACIAHQYRQLLACLQRTNKHLLFLRSSLLHGLANRSQ